MTVDVLLLTQDHCRLCEHAKQVLARVAADYPLEVTALDLASPAVRELATLGGIRFPPGLFLDGEPFSYGRVSERRLRREIVRRLHAVKE